MKTQSRKLYIKQTTCRSTLQYHK